MPVLYNVIRRHRAFRLDCQNPAKPAAPPCCVVVSAKPTPSRPSAGNPGVPVKSEPPSPVSGGGEPALPGSEWDLGRSPLDVQSHQPSTNDAADLASTHFGLYGEDGPSIVLSVAKEGSFITMTHPGDPYLHDGSAATRRGVLTRRNPQDQHDQRGKHFQLTRFLNFCNGFKVSLLK